MVKKEDEFFENVGLVLTKITQIVNDIKKLQNSIFDQKEVHFLIKEMVRERQERIKTKIEMFFAVK